MSAVLIPSSSHTGSSAGRLDSFRAHVVRDSIPRATGRTSLRLVLWREPSFVAADADGSVDVEACGGSMSMVILDTAVEAIGSKATRTT